MLLDTGICIIYTVSNIAENGNMPKQGLTKKYESWYGELNFETSPKYADMQEAVEISKRIRIIQNKSINNHDVVILSTESTQYDIIRAYHGIDDDNGQPITDLTLVKVVNEYAIE